MALPAEAATSARRDVVPILVEDTARDALRVMPTPARGIGAAATGDPGSPGWPTIGR